MLTVSCGMIAFMLIKRDPEQHFFFFFNDTATTEIYTLSLHDALPISSAAANMANRKSLPRQFDSRVAPFRQCRTQGALRKSTVSSQPRKERRNWKSLIAVQIHLSS